MTIKMNKIRKKTMMMMMVMMMMVIMMMMIMMMMVIMMVMVMMVMHLRPISFILSRHSSSETVAAVKQHVNALQMPSQTVRKWAAEDVHRGQPAVR